MDSGHDDIAKMLLDRKGCGMDLADREGDTALHLATRHSNKKLAAVLLRKGANADLKNSAGDLPLTEAIRSGDLTMAQVCCSPLFCVSGQICSVPPSNSLRARLCPLRGDL